MSESNPIMAGRIRVILPGGAAWKLFLPEHGGSLNMAESEASTTMRKIDRHFTATEVRIKLKTALPETIRVPWY